MPEWWTYRLSDLLLFSPRTYYRMFELYHRQIWPIQVVAIGSVAALTALMRADTQWGRRTVAGLLAAWWLWVGIAFHLNRYSTINWAAKYFAALFVIQSVLIVWQGIVRDRLQLKFGRDLTQRLAVGVLAVAVVMQPIAGAMTARTWSQVELVGVTPDPTAVATLALLALAVPRAPWSLLVIPTVSCAIGAATLWALGSAETWIVLLATIAGLVLAIRQRAYRSAPRK
jgi:hypothetical protein